YPVRRRWRPGPRTGSDSGLQAQPTVPRAQARAGPAALALTSRRQRQALARLVLAAASAGAERAQAVGWVVAPVCRSEPERASPRAPGWPRRAALAARASEVDSATRCS